MILTNVSPATADAQMMRKAWHCFWHFLFDDNEDANRNDKRNISSSYFFAWLFIFFLIEGDIKKRCKKR